MNRNYKYFYYIIYIDILVYAKNSRQQLILSNIQREGFTIYYYYFIQTRINEKILYDQCE